MMRKHNSYRSLPKRFGLIPSALGISVFALCAAVPAAAQNSPGSFSLPTASPTPTPAPQGPSDERAGVPIAPRVIPDRTQTQQPLQPPTPSPTPAPTLAPAETTTPADIPASVSPPTSQVSTESAASGAPATDPSPATGTADFTPPAVPQQSGASAGSDIAPGFSTDLIPGEGERAIGPDDWYDVSPDGNVGADPAVTPSQSSSSTSNYVPGEIPALRQMAMRNQLYIGIGIMAVLSAILAYLFWRRRRSEAIPLAIEGPSLAMGVRKVISEGQDEGAPPYEAPRPAPQPKAAPKPAPRATPEPEPIAAAAKPAPKSAVRSAPQEPARLDIGLDVTTASRSVMMFTVHFRIEIANRSNRAVRDLNISAQMAFAQRGASNGAPVAAGQPVDTIERLGPQQSRAISGSLSLPLAELKTIHQGSKPLFIPLIHVTSVGSDQPVENVSFVIGSPSASSTGRVHPLTLDGPPGGLPGLRAQLIKAPASQESDAAQSA